jgi:nucleotide-binding universal stress UspA family protein
MRAPTFLGTAACLLGSLTCWARNPPVGDDDDRNWIVDIARPRDRSEPRIQHEHPYQAIIETAKKQGCDAIVMASHGRRGVSAIVLGSETVKVLTNSTIPVLVYR